MYKICFKYDITGLENTIFSTEEDAIEWFNAHAEVKEEAKEDFGDVANFNSCSFYELYLGWDIVYIEKLTLYKG